jgi:hypothetical protein
MFLRFVEKLSFVDAYTQNLAAGSVTQKSALMKTSTLLCLFALAFPFQIIAQATKPLKNTILLEGGAVIFGKGDYRGFGTAVVYTRDLSKWLDLNVGSGVTHASNFSPPIDLLGKYSVTVFYSLAGIGIKPIRIGEKFALKLEGGLAPKYISSARDRYRRDYTTKEGTQISVIYQETYKGFKLSTFISAKLQLSLDRYHFATGIRMISEPDPNSIFFGQIGLRF